MPLAIFDLDNTLLDGDSEWMWSEFLYQQGIVGKDFIAQIEYYYHDYEQGRLDFNAYEAFLLHPLTLYPHQELLILRESYLNSILTKIRRVVTRRAAWHRAQGHVVILITATNHFLAEPIAEILSFSNLICTEIEFQNGRFTGNLSGIPAFREGKTIRLNQWLKDNEQTLARSWGYSDSVNDLPLLDKVEHPVAVTPDPILRQHAFTQGWEIIDL